MVESKLSRGPTKTLKYAAQSATLVDVDPTLAETHAAGPTEPDAAMLREMHAAEPSVRDAATLGETHVATPSELAMVPESDRRLATQSEGNVRTTVLPRVEHVEGAPRVVVQGRPRYEELKALGSGGQAHVLLARDHDINRKVAVKRLRYERRDAASVLRFAEEVRAVGQLEHPNVVPIHDVGIDPNGSYFYVMKHVEGENLEAIIGRLRMGDPAYLARYTNKYRMQICYEVLRGVEHAHSLGILHRDLKPSNIMVGSLGEVHVMDWGLAKVVGVPELAQGSVEQKAMDSRTRLFETQHGTLIGTPAYMSPEQAAGQFGSLDARTDIYSLAVMFYEFLCLRHPRRHCTSVAEMLASVTSEPVTKQQVFADFASAGTPASLSHFVWHGLQQAPGERYASVAAMRARLEMARDGCSPIECQITLVQGALSAVSRGIDRHPVGTTIAMLVSVVAVLAAMGALMWFLMT